MGLYHCHYVIVIVIVIVIVNVSPRPESDVTVETLSTPEMAGMRTSTWSRSPTRTFIRNFPWYLLESVSLFTLDNILLLKYKNRFIMYSLKISLSIYHMSMTVVLCCCGFLSHLNLTTAPRTTSHTKIQKKYRSDVNHKITISQSFSFTILQSHNPTIFQSHNLWVSKSHNHAILQS